MEMQPDTKKRRFDYPAFIEELRPPLNETVEFPAKEHSEEPSAASRDCDARQAERYLMSKRRCLHCATQPVDCTEAPCQQ